jgi:DNA sulfur modification protein DndC
MDLDVRLSAILAELRDEYLKHHAHPWVVGFSGGKDSTCMLQLVVDMLMDMPRSKRRRHVYVVSNDTLVESPLVISHLKKVLDRMRDGFDALRIPVSVHVTLPKPDQTFWCNVIGRGYPPPSRMFRWCTDRMKIRPTTEFVKERVSETGKVILLLGVRSDESRTRAASVEKYTVRDEQGKAERLNPHSDLKGAMVFRPIVDLTTEEVWQVLLQRRPAWGGSA